MGLSVSHLDWLHDQVVLSQFDQLLEDLRFELEAREMATVGHNSESLSNNKCVKAYIEHRAYAWNRTNPVIEIPHALESDIHDLWLLMLHCEDNGVNNGLEHLTLELEHALSAMKNNVMHKLEEWFSELRVANEVARNHFESWLTKATKNIYKESSKVLSLLVENGGKQHHCLWITSVCIRLMIVLHHCLQCWEEVLVEKIEMCFLFNINLDKL